MTDRELMQQALDLLDDINQCSLPPTGIPLPAEIDHVMEALRARLTQPEPEPVAWIKARELTYMKAVVEHGATEWKTNLGLKPEDGDVPLYTTPPQREWQGLTDEEIREFEIWLDDEEEKHGWNPPADIVKYMETKLKEKNHG